LNHNGLNETAFQLGAAEDNSDGEPAESGGKPPVIYAWMKKAHVNSAGKCCSSSWAELVSVRERTGLVKQRVAWLGNEKSINHVVVGGIDYCAMPNLERKRINYIVLKNESL